MKKLLIPVICAGLSLTGCGNQSGINKTIDGMKTYYEMKDGTWQCGDYSYQYRLEIKGRLSNAVCDSVYVYLSNIPEITWDQAWKAGGLSSNSNDYFKPEDAVLVELRTE